MFEWDESKAIENKSKHGISSVTLEDFRKGEQRYVTIGMDAFGRILVVVYTWREENIRIISARKAVRYEVRQYEGEI
ncbi:MAG: BrnT family toxin [Deltaproteobacteria bacterium]|nr:BrnT family toxin [Deltaproteobacteria bacterium]